MTSKVKNRKLTQLQNAENPFPMLISTSHQLRLRSLGPLSILLTFQLPISSLGWLLRITGQDSLPPGVPASLPFWLQVKPGSHPVLLQNTQVRPDFYVHQRFPAPACPLCPSCLFPTPPATNLQVLFPRAMHPPARLPGAGSSLSIWSSRFCFPHSYSQNWQFHWKQTNKKPHTQNKTNKYNTYYLPSQSTRRDRWAGSHASFLRFGPSCFLLPRGCTSVRSISHRGSLWRPYAFSVIHSALLKAQRLDVM